MKLSRPAFFAAALAVIPVVVQSAAIAVADGAEQSARSALKVLAQNRGAHYLGRVLMVEGRYGNHQPQAWRVIAADPQIQGRVREFMINGEQIDSERALLAWKQGRRVPLREVTVDSSDAFLQADLAAKDAKIGFDSLDYQLIMPTEGEEPLWLVTLVGKTGDAVGEVQVGARTGVVMRKAWPKPDVEQLQQDRDDQRSSANRVSVAKKPQPASVKTAHGSSRGRDPRSPAAAQKTEAAMVKAGAARPPAGLAWAATDGTTLKEASGQILEEARQGIIRTSGTVRDFFKGLQDR